MVLDEELTRADAQVAIRVGEDPAVARLTTCPSIGPLTATAFVAALDDVRRFEGPRGAAQVASYLGLVPREYSSGEQQQRGHIMRSAQPYVQALLVQAAWRVCRSTDPRTAALRTWAQAIAGRRGRRSPSSPWPDGWPAFSTPCGAMGLTMNPRGFDRLEARRRARHREPVEPPPEM